MNKKKATTFVLCALLLAGCSTNTGTGALIGTGGGAVLGAIVGKIAGNTAVGTAVGAAVGAGAGAAIGKHMDKVKAQTERELQNAKVEEVTDANGLKAVKVTFDSGILFDLNKSTLSSSSMNELARFSNVLKSNSDCSVDIYGYTDRSGGDGINVPLSQKRAQAVADYLRQCGVSNMQMKNITGMGSQNPIVDSNVAKENRRVEVFLYASEAMMRDAENGNL